MKILIIAHFNNGPSGWTKASIEYCLALDAVGYDVVCRSVNLTNTQTELPLKIQGFLSKDCQNVDICIQCILPHHFEYSTKFKKNLGLIFTETDSIKWTPWVEKINLLDGIIVACNSSKECLENSGIKVPIYIVPVPTDITKFSKQYEKLKLPTNDDFIFYTIGTFDRRKNLSALLKAFHTEFDRSEPVSLVIKTNKFNLNPQECGNEVQNYFSEIKKGLKLYSSLLLYKQEIIITNYMSEEQINQLHNTCDCFVMSSHGEGYCTLGVTNVDTAFGKKQIKDIDIGDMVYTHTGKTSKVSNKIIRDYTGELINIKVTGVNERLSFTPNHPHYIVQRNNIKYIKNVQILPNFIEAKDIKVGDLFVMPKLKNNINTTTQRFIQISDYVNVTLDKDGMINCPHSFSTKKSILKRIANKCDCSFQHVSKVLNGGTYGTSELDMKIKDYIKKTNIRSQLIKKIPNKIYLTDDFMFFLGHYIAEGNSAESQIQLATHKLESFGRKISKRAIISAFNLKPKEQICLGKECINLYFCNSIIASFLRKFCGHLAKNKFINNNLKYQPNIGSLLRGLFYGDGTLDGKGYYKYTTISENLKDDIIQCLLSNNLFAYESKIDRRHTNLCYGLVIPKSLNTRFEKFTNIYKYNKKCKSSPNIRNHRFLEDNNNFYLPIKSVTKQDYSGLVYNLTVDNDNSYTCNRCATHNCLPAFDAMGFGKWPICTKNTSMDDFIIDGENGYLIDSYYVPAWGILDNFSFLYTGRENWREIDIDALRNFMRLVYTNKPKPNKDKLGEHLEKFSYAKVGGQLKQILET